MLSNLILSWPTKSSRCKFKLRDWANSEEIITSDISLPWPALFTQATRGSYCGVECCRGQGEQTDVQDAGCGGFGWAACCPLVKQSDVSARASCCNYTLWPVSENPVTIPLLPQQKKKTPSILNYQILKQSVKKSNRSCCNLYFCKKRKKSWKVSIIWNKILFLLHHTFND